jgi:hypothetical protein
MGKRYEQENFQKKKYKWLINGKINFTKMKIWKYLENVIPGFWPSKLIKVLILKNNGKIGIHVLFARV